MRSEILVGGGERDYATPQKVKLKYANRHGLIAGATGTGKTVTLQIMAEEFSKCGVPVFMADVKGDLSGLAVAGTDSQKLHDAFQSRVQTIGIEDFQYQAFPTVFWDLFGESGHPIRTTLAEMGPLILSRLLELSEAQEGVINIAYRLADEEGLALLDLKDLQRMLVWMGENSRELTLRYGNIAASTIGSIQRQLLILENQGAVDFFGEPALDLSDMMRVDASGRGQVNILAANKLMATPKLYATFLLWLLSELFETLPEVGDPDKPKLVFFFDEAHLLFDDAPKALVDKVEQVARLIRSKGVGVYFVTQSPDDIPEDILGQLGNRVQHALRAYTARDQQALRRAAQTYRVGPDMKIEEAILQVGVGEAVTSFLGDKGVPGFATRTLIRPPQSQLGPIQETRRAEVIQASDLEQKYRHVLDRVSAYEILNQRAQAAAAAAEAVAEEHPTEDMDDPADRRVYNSARRIGGAGSARRLSKPRGRKAEAGGIGEALGRALVKELSGTTGRRIIRGVLGGLFKRR